MLSIYEQIEQLIDPSLGNRGLRGEWCHGNLEKIVRLLNSARKVLIITGFCIPECQIGETDGPLGALSIAASLRKLDKEVYIGTDSYSYSISNGASKIIGLSQCIVNIESKSETDFKHLVQSVDVLLFIERPSKAKDGLFYNMNGKNISEYVIDTDVCITWAKEMTIPVVAIGDGGNEVGMGSIASKISKFVPLGSLICAQSRVDYLLLSSISNWGGYAVSAGLQKMSNEACLNDLETEKKLLYELVKYGAVDGVTKKNEPSVDGVKEHAYFEEYKKILDLVSII